MSSKHTQEPWQLPKFGQRTICTKKGQTVAILFQCNDTDAERIVACVNACTGLNPEAIPEFIAASEAMAGEYIAEAITVDRNETGDALLAALAKLRKVSPA